MTKTTREILEETFLLYRDSQTGDYRIGYQEDTIVPLDQALKEIEAIHQQEIAKARIDELNRLISITRINGEQVINQATYSLALDRISELSGRNESSDA